MLMTHQWKEQIGFLSEEEVLQAAREFATVLAETPEYQAFEEAQRQLRHNPAAQEAIRAFQEKQQALGWQAQFGFLSDAEQEELRRLQQAMVNQPAVQNYMEAQERLRRLCQEVADTISQVIGLNFATGCGPGCC
ncbi:MAG: YlbF family regulator [Nitrospinota bacterium]|nr:MAG: YlbF family regulator [Nitrospinota bacterium]